MRVHVTTAGLDTLTQNVSRAANFLGGAGIRRVLQEHGKLLVQEYRQNIATFTPGPVRDITQQTKKDKARKGYAVYPILVRTGDMVNSIYSEVVAAGRTGWTIRLRFRGVNRSGSRNADVALAHIQGNAHLPARDFTFVSDAWRDNLMAAMLRR